MKAIGQIVSGMIGGGLIQMSDGLPFWLGLLAYTCGGLILMWIGAEVFGLERKQ